MVAKDKMSNDRSDIPLRRKPEASSQPRKRIADAGRLVKLLEDPVANLDEIAKEIGQKD
ncbi:MAG: hypothetical protein WCI56_11670 [Hyphomicrobiales bacterium]